MTRLARPPCIAALIAAERALESPKEPPAVEPPLAEEDDLPDDLFGGVV